jgi:hypothetical protein
MSSLISTFLSLSGLIFIILSIIATLGSLTWNQTVIPEVDLSRCPPISSNPKRLWAYWHTGAAKYPKFVERNLKMWKAVNPDWELRLIEGANPNSECHVLKFVPREMLPKYLDQMVIQKQSDAARLALLRLYGGIYMDATILIFEPLEFSYWNHVETNMMVGYYFERYTLPGKKDGFEIWMIAARGESPLIIAWHDYFLDFMTQGPSPFIRNETTGELNTRFKDVNLSKISEYFLNYGVSTTCLHALLQLNKTVEDWYENKSLIRNADNDVYALSTEMDWDPPRHYEYFFEPKMFTKNNIIKMTKNVPIMKLITHAFYIDDASFDKWSSLNNNLGYIYRKLTEKGKLWQKEGIWNDTFT